MTNHIPAHFAGDVGVVDEVDDALHLPVDQGYEQHRPYKDVLHDDDATIWQVDLRHRT